MKNFKVLFVILFIIPFVAQAQGLQPMPMDTAIRYGKLSNGLTYYIRHNEQPKERAEFYIAQNVGAILEEDSQNGLAHFLEHMAFNGTKHFPGNSLLNYFETVGVKFGQNINAYTSLDETVYNLSEVPTTRGVVIDSALLVLHDWSSFLLLEDKEIDKERGVIREEWRTRQSAYSRVADASRKVTLAGSQYAKRDVIGDTAIINNFPYQTLRNYYKKWYRPDLQAIIIVGDIDVAKVESKIKDLFSDILAPVNPAKRIFYPVPDNDEPIVGVFTDPELETTDISLDFKHDAIPDTVRLTVQGYMLDQVSSLITSMANMRLNEIKQEPETPFTGSYAYISGLTRTKDTFSFSCTPVSGKEKTARERLLKEAEKIRRYGFTESELERAKTNMLSNYEKAYNERNQRKNNNLTREYARNFLSAEPIPGIEWEYRFLSENLPSINIDMVNQVAKSFLGEKNIIYTMAGPEKEGLTYPTNDELKQELMATRTTEIKAYQDNVSNEPLIAKKLKPGKIKKAYPNETLGTTEWILSNGIKVIFKPTKFKEDEMLMFAWSDGGKSLLQQEDLPSAMYATAVIRQSGLGTFNQSELRKKLTGKIANVSPSISEYDESFWGTSSVKDLGTLLQLTNLNFTAPREDENAYQYVMKSMKTYLENAALNPENAYYDSITTTVYGNNPRVLLSNMENLKKTDYPSIMRIYKDRFANPADFTFIFVGNLEEKTFRPLIELYLGSLKTNKKLENWKDNNIRIQKGQIYKELEKPLKVSKTTNYIRYTIDMPYNLENQVVMNTLGNLLRLRYTATIREEEGGSYGVGVGGFLSKRPVETATLGIQFDTDPKIYKKMLDIAHKEIQTIAENGPKAEDLNKVKLNLIKQYNEDLTENNWWVSTISSYYRENLNIKADYENIVNKIDSEKIKATAKAILEQNNCIEMLLMPENK